MKFVQVHMIVESGEPEAIFINLATVCWLVRTSKGTMIMFPYRSIEVEETPAQIKTLANGT